MAVVIGNALVVSQDAGLELLLVPQPDGRLRLDLHVGDGGQQVLMGRQTVEAVHAFLGRWLDETPSPGPPPGAP